MAPAIVVPPPPPFSTTIGCPSCADNGSKTTRGMTSVALPAAKATIARIGLLGQVCATASPHQPTRKTKITNDQRGIRHSSLGVSWQEKEASAVPSERARERVLPPKSLGRDDGRALGVFRHLAQLRLEPVLEHAVDPV